MAKHHKSGDKKVTQKEIIKEYFVANPNVDLPTAQIVDWVTREYAKRTGKTFRDPDRGIRQLAQEGYLMKIRKGLYRYEPNRVRVRNIEEFTAKQKEEIKKRDGYKCVFCGIGEKEGEELHIDHITPRDKGGQATIDNGQTLCTKHNNIKKNYGQTEAGKRFFIDLHRRAVRIGDKDFETFCDDVLDVFEKHEIDMQIKHVKRL